MLDLDDRIMMLSQRVVPKRRRRAQSLGLDSGLGDVRTWVNTIMSLQSSTKQISLFSQILCGYPQRHSLKLSTD